MKPFLRTSNSQACCSGKHENHNVAHWALLTATPSLTVYLETRTSLYHSISSCISSLRLQVLSQDTPPACRKTACAGQYARQTCQQTSAVWVPHGTKEIQKTWLGNILTYPHGWNWSIFLHMFIDVACIALFYPVSVRCITLVMIHDMCAYICTVLHAVYEYVLTVLP